MTINAAQVGFGAAILAGVVLAIIGHPGPKDLRPSIPTIMEVHPVTEIAFRP